MNLKLLKINDPLTYDALMRAIQVLKILNKILDSHIDGFLNATPSQNPPNPLDAFGKLLEINHNRFINVDVDPSPDLVAQSPIQCAICSKKMHPGASVQIYCLHTFHTYCLFQEMAQKGPVINCPVCRWELIASSIFVTENGLLNLRKMEEVLGMHPSQESVHEVDIVINDIMEWWRLGYVRILQALAFYYSANRLDRIESKPSYMEMRKLLNRTTKEILQTGDSVFGTKRDMKEEVKKQVERLKVRRKALFKANLSTKKL